MSTHLRVRSERLKPISGQGVPRAKRRIPRCAHGHAAERVASGPKRRPGRLFKRFPALLEYRGDYNPRDLGEADWILYGRNLNPHRRGSWKFRHYERGYAESKTQLPRQPHALEQAPYRKG